MTTAPAALAGHRLERLIGPGPHKVANPGYTVLGWRVADIEEAVHALTLKGVEFTQHDGMDQDLNGIWTTPGGDKVAWFTDPDGNTVSLTEYV